MKAESSIPYTREQGYCPAILLAEDDDEMRNVLALHLRREGNTVTECRNGAELLAELADYLSTPRGRAAKQYDLVISDIRMPGVFGLSIVEGARDRPGFPPTILITAFGDDETHETARQCGVVAVFDKPFEMNELLEKVRTSITAKGRKRAEANELPYEPDVLRVLQSKQETKHFYNKIAPVYDLLAEHSERPMREKGLELLAVTPGETVLEVGCGTGHCLSELARGVGPNGKVLGVDISENMLAEAKKTLDKDGCADRVELHCGDAEHLPYDSESIDGMFASFTLELFDTPELPKVLAEWRRVLKPGGRLVVVAVSKRGGRRIVVKAFEWTHKHFPNLMDCRPIYVSRALQAADFRIQDVKEEQMWVPVEIVLGVKQAS